MKNTSHIKSHRNNHNGDHTLPNKREEAPTFGQNHHDTYGGGLSWSLKEKEKLAGICYSEDDHMPDDIRIGIETIYGPTDVDVTTDSVWNIYKKEEPWVQTYTGKRFQPLNPTQESIDIEDIAHALSMICRFNGHSKEFYSVAQHCVLVSYACDSDDAAFGLLHDASESYIADVSSPLKHSGQFENYKIMEDIIQTAIYKKFGLKGKEPPSVKRADKQLLYTEARDLMAPLHPDWVNAVDPLPWKIEAWDQKKSKAEFLKRFYELFRE